MKQLKVPHSLRQGDVLLVRVDVLPAGATEAAQPKEDLILMHGEATGHAHRIREVESLRVFDYGAERFIQALDVVALTHEEHDPVEIPAGIWKQSFQVEDFGEKVRPVVD